MTVTILRGDCRNVLRDVSPESVHCVVTSPPYFGLRDYGVAGQIGLETTPQAFVAELVGVFRSVRRVLRCDGTLWLNLGDSYNSGAEIGRHEARDNPFGIATTQKFFGTERQYGKRVSELKPKDLFGIPWRVAFALQADGWYLRQDIIWSKPNPMPESVRDRCTKAHEYLFLLSKSERYFYDQDAIAEPHGSNWLETRKRYEIKGNDDRADKGQPPQSAREMRPCILAGCPKGGTVLDPFGGAGTTGLVADRLGRNATLIELNPEYAAMAERRIRGDAPLFADIQGAS